jgi:hypothetical protein
MVASRGKTLPVQLAWLAGSFHAQPEEGICSSEKLDADPKTFLRFGCPDHLS